MNGKSQPVVPLLQAATTWSDMRVAFLEYFAADRHVVLTEL